MKKFDLIAQVNKKKKLSLLRANWQKQSFPNLIQRNFDKFKTKNVWYTDITNLIFNKERNFFSAIIDGKMNIVAHYISKRENWNLVKKTLDNALKTRKNEKNKIIIHSDQGGIYTSKRYRDYCEQSNLIISMSRKANPLDNALIESFFGLLKKETLYNNNFKSMKEYLDKVKWWIKFYNTKRIRYNENNFC